MSAPPLPLLSYTAGKHLHISSYNVASQPSEELGSGYQARVCELFEVLLYNRGIILGFYPTGSKSTRFLAMCSRLIAYS